MKPSTLRNLRDRLATAKDDRSNAKHFLKIHRREYRTLEREINTAQRKLGRLKNARRPDPAAVRDVKGELTMLVRWQNAEARKLSQWARALVRADEAIERVNIRLAQGKAA